MVRPYYTLLILAMGDDWQHHWQVEFGSWDQEAVEQERSDYLDLYGGRAETLVIITDGTQAQIDDMIRVLDERLKRSKLYN